MLAPATPPGVSTIESRESSPYTVTILAPPAPAGRTSTIDPAPVISGNKRASNAVQALVDGSPACTFPADDATTWIFTPHPALRPWTRTITATQTSPGGDTSPAATPISVRVLEPASLATTHSSPTTAVPTTTTSYNDRHPQQRPRHRRGGVARSRPGRLPRTRMHGGGVRIDCAGLAAGVPLGDIIPGRKVAVRMIGVVPEGTPGGTTYPVTSRLSGRSDAASPVSAAGTITAAAPPAPLMDSPAQGSSTTGWAPPISGTGLTGATVAVYDATGPVCTATVACGSGWGCTPTRAPSPSAASTSGRRRASGISPPRPASSRSRDRTHRSPTARHPSPATRNTARPSRRGPSGTPGARPQPGQHQARTAAHAPPPHATSLEQLPMNLRFPGAELATGIVSAMRGSLGPNTAPGMVTVSFDGSVRKGAIYRSGRVTPGGTCEVVTASLRCTVTLPPGEEAVVEIRLVAGALNAPTRWASSSS